MRQAVMVEPGKIELREVPVPAPKEDEVLIEIKRIGVCGSDIHVYYGKHPYTSYPVVQGHEFSGRIAAVGNKVKDLSVGQIVTASPQIFCGKCGPCKSGKYHICDTLKVMGFQAPGCAQDFFPIPADKIVVLPSTFTYEEGAIVEPLAVAVHAVERAGDVAGKNVVVMGAGPIGNFTAQVARAKGAKKVAITDFSDYRLGKAAACGIEYPIDLSKQDFAKAAAEIFKGEEIDVFLECVGAEKALASAVSSVKKGGTIIIVGVYSANASVDMGLVQDREINIIGTLMYQTRDYEAGVALIQAGKINTKEYITNFFSFEDYQKAYQYIEDAKGKSMKVMIKL